MKKALILVFFAAVTFQVSAANEIMFQGMYLNSSRNYSEGSSDFRSTYSAAGLNITSFNSRTGTVGLFTTGSFLLPLEMEGEQNGIIRKASLEDFSGMRIGLDLLFGPGFNIDSGAVAFLLGGGLHFNGIALMPSSTYDDYLSYTLGAGVSANLKFNLTRSFNLNISAMGAYDFWEMLRVPELESSVSFDNALTYGLSAGLGFSY